MYFVLLGFGLSLFWLVLSGFWEHGLLLALGLGSVVLTLALMWRIRRQYQLHSDYSMIFRLPGYMVWVIVEVIKANISVVKNIWFPEDHPISPTVRRIPMLQKTRLGRTIFANSITLTPGTVSFDIQDDGVLVHGVMEEAVIELMDGEMNQRVAALEHASSEPAS